jgi:transposase
VRRRATEWLEHLPAHAACAIRDLREHLRVLDERVKEYERSIEAHARDHDAAKLAQRRLGIGPLTASAIVASVGDVRESENDREHVHNEMTHLRRASDWVSRSAPTACYAAGTRHLFFVKIATHQHSGQYDGRPELHIHLPDAHETQCAVELLSV